MLVWSDYGLKEIYKLIFIFFDNDSHEYGYKFDMNYVNATIGFHNLPHIPDLLK